MQKYMHMLCTDTERAHIGTSISTDFDILMDPGTNPLSILGTTFEK